MLCVPKSEVRSSLGFTVVRDDQVSSWVCECCNTKTQKGPAIFKCVQVLLGDDTEHIQMVGKVGTYYHLTEKKNRVEINRHFCVWWGKGTQAYTLIEYCLTQLSRFGQSLNFSSNKTFSSPLRRYWSMELYFSLSKHCCTCFSRWTSLSFLLFLASLLSERRSHGITSSV